MIYNSKGFNFNGYNSGGFISDSGSPIEIYNVVLENDMYTQSIIGSRSIHEVKIPGRDKPYLYHLEEGPLEFDMHIAFVNPISKNDARKIARWLLTPKTYKPLIFERDENKVFYVVFTDSVEFTYVSNSTGATFNSNITVSHTNGEDTTIILHEAISITPQAGVTFNPDSGLLIVDSSQATGQKTIEYQVYESELVGYMSLSARCNAPTAFSLLTTTGLKDGSGFISTKPIIQRIIAVDGDNYTEPTIEIEVPNTSPTPPTQGATIISGIIIKNNTNNSFIGITDLESEESIKFDASLKTLTSSHQSTSPIYPRWSRTELILEIDANDIEVEYYSVLSFDTYGNIEAGSIKLTGAVAGPEIQFKLDYQAPKYI